MLAKGLGLVGTNGILGQCIIYRIIDSLLIWPVLRPKYHQETGTKLGPYPGYHQPSPNNLLETEEESSPLVRPYNKSQSIAL